VTSRRAWGWAFAGVCSAAIAVWPADPAVSRWFAAQRRPGLDPAVLALTSAWTLTVFVVAACVWLAARRRLRESLAVAGVTLATLGVGSVLKVLVGRHRPYESLADFVSLKTAADASFPSNHTSGAFAACLVLAGILPRLRIPCVLFAVSIALTRLYIGVHYLSDVVGGLALALAFAFLARTWILPAAPAEAGSPGGGADPAPVAAEAGRTGPSLPVPPSTP